MWTFHFSPEQVTNLQSKIIMKTLLQYNYQFQQNNRIIYPLAIIIKEYKTFSLIEKFQGE